MKRTLILLMAVMASIVTLSGHDHTRYDEAVALYSLDDKEFASRLVEMALEAYPDNVMFLSDKAGLAFVAGDLQNLSGPEQHR